MKFSWRPILPSIQVYLDIQGALNQFLIYNVFQLSLSRVLYVNVCNCVWNTVLSFSHHSGFQSADNERKLLLFCAFNKQMLHFLSATQL